MSLVPRIYFSRKSASPCAHPKNYNAEKSFLNIKKVGAAYRNRNQNSDGRNKKENYY